MKTNPLKLQCPKCHFTQTQDEWASIADYDYKGDYATSTLGGDHARCPQCENLLHIDYDLIERN